MFFNYGSDKAKGGNELLIGKKTQNFKNNLEEGGNCSYI